MTSEIEKAQEIKAEYESFVENLQRNDDLTVEARQKQADEKYADVTARLESVKTLAQMEDKKAIAEARRQVFGWNDEPLTPADALSYRDALDRIQSIDEEPAAVARLEDAFDARDEMQAKAILNAAIKRGWSTVVDRYTQEHPVMKDRVSDLLRKEQAMRSPRSRIGMDLAFSVPVRRTIKKPQPAGRKFF